MRTMTGLGQRYRPATLAAQVLLVILSGWACGGSNREPLPDPESPIAAGYTGAAACRPCHPSLYDVWDASSHGRGMAVASPETVVGDFASDTVHRFRDFSARMTRTADGFYVILFEPGASPDTLQVDLVIGTRQMQGYLTRMPDGRYQELPVVVQRSTGNWVEASSGGTLPTDVVLGPTDWYYWRNPGRAWNSKCYNCHASQIQKRYDSETDTYDTQWVDLSINCETCHGPGADHVRFWNDRVAGGVVDASPDTTLVKLESLAPSKSVDVCAQCHALKTIADDTFLPGHDFNDFYQPILWDNAAVTWPDGLFRGDAYTYVGYLKNRCYVEGGMDCTHCHDPHGSPHPNDLRASRDESDRFCAPCHPNYTSDPRPHTRHRRDGPGGRCIGCHMATFEPAMFIAEGMRLTDHRLVSPLPEATERYGIPNGCAQTGCHPDKTAAWADEWSRKWYGDYQEAPLREIAAIQDAIDGNSRGVRPLLQILGDDTQLPAERATAASLLGRFREEGVVEGLAVALEDPSPLVRSRAALSLRRLGDPSAGLFLEPLVDDPNRFVRTNAALAMIALGTQPSDDATGAALENAWEEYGDLLKGLWSDDPQAHAVRGDLLLSQGKIDSAATAYRQSLRIWQHNPAVMLRLAGLESNRGNLEEARSLTLEALQLEPGNSQAIGLLSQILGPVVQQYEQRAAGPKASWQTLYDLGSLYMQLARYGDAATLFARAIKADAEHPEAYRDLGLSHANAERYPEAIRALQTYLKRAGNAQDADQVRSIVGQLREAKATADG